MNRRDFIILAGGTTTWPLAICAQENEKIHKIGVLWRAGNAEQEGTSFKSLVKGFSELGYAEGRNPSLEHRFPNETAEQFKSMAAELAASSPGVLIGVGSHAAAALKIATSTTPIVFTLVADPVGSKLVESLQQPGGNTTGLVNFGAGAFRNHLQILKDMVPGLVRVALLVNPNDQSSRPYADALRSAAAELGLTGQSFEWRTTNDLGPAFDEMKRAGVQVFTTNPDGLAFTHRALIAQIAAARSLPLSVWSREAMKGGAIMAYAVDQGAICERTAAVADKILKGAKAGELPVEQPIKFELVVSLKAAKAFGLDVPAQVRQLANAVVAD